MVTKINLLQTHSFNFINNQLASQSVIFLFLSKQCENVDILHSLYV